MAVLLASSRKLSGKPTSPLLLFLLSSGTSERIENLLTSAVKEPLLHWPCCIELTFSQFTCFIHEQGLRRCNASYIML